VAAVWPAVPAKAGQAAATVAAGGGGSGTSIAAGMTNTSIARRYAEQTSPPVQNGTVTITWADVEDASAPS
jgi:hypothetical protein